jgi:hypothetical protein
MLALTLAGPASAGIIDMRDCRLDTVTFIDPVAGGAFTVRRVGRNSSCTRKAVCDGRLGDLVLAGRLSEPGEAPLIVYAIWHTEPAAPCCGWRVLAEKEGRKLAARAGFHWLDRAPRLGETGFASIYFDEAHQEGRDIFSAPKVAMRCLNGREDTGSR